ncbi:pyridoxamine 5'-phosphate oxidase family protein [uncultured Winogradskyella sp.]|uniref:pyridoxamine 5'-phosphate oxidase family protein n=1 Tax=uncultured Winogradskyella sp. TaxID=395353 RepID=UPI002609CFF0|nr:pyridoxamine 5'-phosphate oxidase family protein [uncultured Winogradskyella sp.]
MIDNLNTNEKAFILHTNYIGDLGYLYHNEPSIAPITYFYNEDENNITCHLSNTHKIKALRENRSVSLCVSAIHSINDWKSVLVHGTFKEHKGSGAKSILHNMHLGIQKLMRNKKESQLDFINQFSSKINKNDIPIIFTIEIDAITGTRN